MDNYNKARRSAGLLDQSEKFHFNSLDAAVYSVKTDLKFLLFDPCCAKECRAKSNQAQPEAKGQGVQGKEAISHDSTDHYNHQEKVNT